MLEKIQHEFALDFSLALEDIHSVCENERAQQLSEAGRVYDVAFGENMIVAFCLESYVRR